jgi:hypothetical protein
MSDKLFYNVPKEKAGSFKSTVSNAIGFVAQTDTEGYMIANGKEFGKMRVSSSNTFDVNGTQYSIIVNDEGALTVSKYIKSTISSLNVTQTGLTKSISYEINGTSGTASANVSNKKLYIGDTYSFTTSLSGTGEFTTTVSVSNSTLNNFRIQLSYYGASETKEYSGNDKSKTLTVTHTDSTISYSISKSGTATWGTNPSISSPTITSYTILSAYAKAELYEGSENVDNESKTFSVSLLTVTTQVHGIYKAGVSNVYTENSDKSISLVSPSEVTSKPTSITIPAGTPIFVFPEVWGTPTFKQLGATDTGWTLSATKTHKTTGKGTCSCKIYTHGKINSEGTWSVSW